ncbi:hypothetical protein COW46_05340 [Candidatus Gracilibacteria bacterium CG17_big_fil_post_rev_8_21_14_2_50_48_13]|nr:MAG: hypothetical protein COW46_05340 [Candidatus Gracilibacteria bacterium CG17_big_fil_post_rev_8_21_14_2_50_48_13]
MQQRIKKNSGALRDAFPEVYAEFFDKCEIISSAPILFTWAGSYAIHFGGMSLIQKLPLRTYIGLKQTKEEGITFVSYTSFSTKKNRFVSMPCDTKFDSAMSARLKEYLPSVLVEELTKGYEVYILSENDWLDTCPIFTCLGVNLLLAANKISTEEAAAITQCASSEQMSARQTEIFRWLWKIFAICDYHPNLAPCGAEVANCLLTSPFPILYRLELAPKETPRISIPLEEYLKSIETRKFKFMTLDTLAPGRASMPLDFGVYFPGAKKMQKALSILTHRKRMDQAQSRLHKRLPQLVGGLEQNDYLSSQVSILDHYAKLVLNEFIESLDAQPTSNLLNALCLLHELYHTVGYAELNSAVSEFQKQLTDLLEELIPGGQFFVKEKGIMGDQKIVFAVTRGSLDHFTEELLELEESNTFASLDYVSWIDGIGKDGLYIEKIGKKEIQDPYQHVLTNYSEYIFSNQQEFSLEKELVVDTLHKRIFVRGNKVTSNEISSQTFTISLLNLLLQAEERTINVSQLPKATYCQNRQEMQSKILTPLSKLISSKLNKNLIFDCIESEEELRIRMVYCNADIWFLTRAENLKIES